MNCDLLLEWMTHLGSGTWSAFSGAVAELRSEEELDADVLSTTVRFLLSDFGHVDFGGGMSRRWQVLHPAVVELAGDEYLLVGGRTRQMIHDLLSRSGDDSVSVSAEPIGPGLSRVALKGPCEAVRRVSHEAGAEYVPNVSAYLGSRLVPIRTALERAKPADEPINWDTEYWSFEEQGWRRERARRTVRRCTPRHGRSRYLIDAGSAGLLELPRREAIYAAAMMRSLRVARYVRQHSALSVPRWAALPDAYSRAACLAGGKAPFLDGRNLVFPAVPEHLSCVILVSLGQACLTEDGPQ